MSAASDITNKFLYGQSSTPADKVDDTWIRPTTVAEPVFNVDVNSFMSSGGGRFALGAQFDFIQDFFTEPVSRFTSNPNFHYGQAMSKVFVAETIFGLGEYDWDMHQYNFSDGSDYAERVYIYNSMSFLVDNRADFIIEANGSRRIEEFAIVPRDDADVPENFDFVGDGAFTQIANGELGDIVDPSKIGRTVNINFTGQAETSTYDSQDFINDSVLKNSFGGFHSATLNAGIADLAENLWNSGVTKFLDSENRPIVYGTTGNNDLDEGDIQGSTWADINGVPTIDDLEYGNNGVVLIGGKGNDTLTGGE